MHRLCANKLGALGILLSDGIHEALGEHSPSAASLLLTLYYQGPMTATALAEVGSIAQPTAARVTGRLVRLGLIRRESRAGRTAPLCLTRAGRRQARALQRLRLVAMKRLLGGLSRTERSQFEEAINKILRHATHSRAFARTTCRLCDHSVCEGSGCPVGSQASAMERQMNSAETRKQ